MMYENYSDIGAITHEAMDISRRSRSMISDMVGDAVPEDRIRQRCVIATGDPGVARILRFVNDPIGAGLRAMARGAGIFVDIRMVEAGVVKKGHCCSLTVFLGSGDDIALSQGITRTSAGVLALQDRLDGAIVLIGNAPSSLLSLCDIMASGRAKPSLVIGTPVGFVNASESKERLRKLDVPSISTEGTRGGTPIAVAAMNEIVNMHYRLNH